VANFHREGLVAYSRLLNLSQFLHEISCSYSPPGS
jgi:hypothetical protein